MTTIQEIRLKNFLELASRYKFKKDFCEHVGILPAYFSQVKHKNKNLGNKTARQIENRLGLPSGYMDTRHEHSETKGKDATNDVSNTTALVAVISQMPVDVQDKLRRLVFSMASEMPSSHDDERESSRSNRQIDDDKDDKKTLN